MHVDSAVWESKAESQRRPQSLLSPQHRPSDMQLPTAPASIVELQHAMERRWTSLAILASHQLNLSFNLGLSLSSSTAAASKSEVVSCTLGSSSRRSSRLFADAWAKQCSEGLALGGLVYQVHRLYLSLWYHSQIQHHHRLLTPSPFPLLSSSLEHTDSDMAPFAHTKEE